MEFDVRHHDYTFKHAYSQSPDLSAARYQEHFHTTYELLFFLKGDADFMLQHTLYKLFPGALLIAKPGEYHNIVFHSTLPYERYVVRFNPFSIHASLRYQLDRAESVYAIHGTPMESIFLSLDRHLHAVHEDMQLSVCIGMLNILLAYLISSHSLSQCADYTNQDALRIVDYIDAHLRDIHSISDLTSALHMSKSSIYKTFSKQFDTSVMSYVRTQKCIQARNLLNSGMPAMDVADALGFTHYSSFYRDYRCVFNENPGKRNPGTEQAH